MKQSEFVTKIKETSDTDLKVLLSQEQENLYRCRQMIALKQLENPHTITIGRKNVARILNEIRAREIKVGKVS